MLPLKQEKAALHKAYRQALKSYFEHAEDCRDIGVHWNNIKTQLTELRRAGRSTLTIEQWAAINAPIGRRWLDEFGKLAHEWGEFEGAWKLWQTVPYTSYRGAPGLKSFLKLSDWKKRYELYANARKAALSKKKRSRKGGNSGSGKTAPVTTAGDVEEVTPLNWLICGEVVKAMKAHIPDEFADVVAADVPYRLSRYSTQVVDYYLDAFGMKPRLAEEWDKFDSLEEYERQAEQWLEQIMRSLKHDGSAFIFGIHTNIGLINRICQKKGYFIINEIAWTARNSRPNASGRMLQGSHQNILWIAKTEGEYRFRYDECKDAHYPDDYFSKAGMQMRELMGHRRGAA